METDEQDVRHYYRVPHPVDGLFNTDRATWFDLTPGLVDAAGNPGPNAFEIISFFSQANADAVGVIEVEGFDNVDLRDPKFGMTFQSDFGRSLPSGHSFEFYHSAARTREFWKTVKTKTGFTSTY